MKQSAFDGVISECIWNAFCSKDVPEKLVAIIKATYDSAKCQVLDRAKTSDEFEIQKRVREGCNLLVRAALAGGPMLSCLKDLDYTDGICLLSHQVVDLCH